MYQTCPPLLARAEVYSLWSGDDWEKEKTHRDTFQAFLKLRKQTSDLSAQIHRQAVCFSPGKYCKNLPSWNSNAMEIGPLDGRNYCIAQRRCYTTDICTKSSPAVAIQAMGIGPKNTSHPTAHSDTHPAHSKLSVSRWKQAPCSRVCVLGSSLQGIEPTISR